MTDEVNAVKDPAEIESTGVQGKVKRWIAELDLADKDEDDWRKSGDEIWKLYKSKSPKANSFNILWSNTETLRPALYNSTPSADVRRRYRDADPVGKIVAQVLQRSLTYAIDVYDFDYHMKRVALDVLLPGRGLARIKYVPKFGEDQAALLDESAPCTHWAWDAFRRGPGKCWDEVTWIAFQHQLVHSQCVAQFGKEIADALKYSETVSPSEKKYDEEFRKLVKTVEVWEVWDKDEERVLFICKGYDKSPLKSVDDPLHLKGFFPMPRPIYAIEDTTTLVPDPVYKRYEIQAEELNLITARIDKIVRAIKVRGAYSSHLSEVRKILEADDNDMIAVENASEVANMGGLDKAIWIMPIDTLVKVLDSLYAARAQIIQTIYEITGLGDVMRGVSNPHETLGAQQLKSQWGGLRLQNLQRELQRFIRDMFCLMGEIMAEHFSTDTFAAITDIQLPHDADKKKAQAMMQQKMQQMQQQAAMQAAQAQQQAAQQAPPAGPPGQQIQGAQPAAAPPAAPPPQIPPEEQEQFDTLMKTPTWEDVDKLLKSEKMRMYRIDIESDSTIAESIQRDQQGFQDAISGVAKIFVDLGPAIEAGYMDIEVAKTLALTAVRNAKAGQAVEDAIEKLKQPPPKPPEQDNSVQVAQIKAKADMDSQAAAQKHAEEMATFQAQMDQQALAAGEQAKQQTAAMQEQSKQQTAQMQGQLQAAATQMAEQMKTDREVMITNLEQKFETWKTQFEGAIKVSIAQDQVEQQAETDAAHLEHEKNMGHAQLAQKAETDNAMIEQKATSDERKAQVAEKSAAAKAKAKPSGA